MSTPANPSPRRIYPTTEREACPSASLHSTTIPNLVDSNQPHHKNIPHLTPVLRKRRTNGEGSLRGRGSRKIGIHDQLKSTIPSPIFKRPLPLSGASLVRFLPPWARNEHKDKSQFPEELYYKIAKTSTLFKENNIILIHPPTYTSFFFPPP